MIVVWCNGSTTGFGSVCRGSNPRTTTKKSLTEKSDSFLLRTFMKSQKHLYRVLWGVLGIQILITLKQILIVKEC